VSGAVVDHASLADCKLAVWKRRQQAFMPRGLFLFTGCSPSKHPDAVVPDRYRSPVRPDLPIRTGTCRPFCSESGAHAQWRFAMTLSTILLIIFILLLVGALPTWGYSRSWGYGPSGGLGLLVVILIVLLLMGRI
jgi:hypothetical protein